MQFHISFTITFILKVMMLHAGHRYCTFLFLNDDIKYVKFLDSVKREINLVNYIPTHNEIYHVFVRNTDIFQKPQFYSCSNYYHTYGLFFKIIIFNQDCLLFFFVMGHLSLNSCAPICLKFSSLIYNILKRTLYIQITIFLK